MNWVETLTLLVLALTMLVNAIVLRRHLEYHRRHRDADRLPMWVGKVVSMSKDEDGSVVVDVDLK